MQLATLRETSEAAETRVTELGASVATCEAELARLRSVKARLQTQVDQLTSADAVSSTHAVVGGKVSAPGRPVPACSHAPKHSHYAHVQHSSRCWSNWMSSGRTGCRTCGIGRRVCSTPAT